MQPHPLNHWWLRLVTFSLAALAAASASYWVLKWRATQPLGATAELAVSDPALDPQAVARLLGGAQAPASSAPGIPAGTSDTPASRFKLAGVVANRAHRGYALIAIDDQPAKPYRVGAPVNDTLVLHSVTQRSAALAPSLDAPVALTLELPPLSPP